MKKVLFILVLPFSFYSKIQELVDNSFWSISKLNRKIKSLTGKTPADYIRNLFLQKAVDVLKHGKNPTYFSKIFKKDFGNSHFFSDEKDRQLRSVNCCCYIR